MIKRFLGVVAAVVLLALCAVGVYAGDVFAGMHAAAQTSGERRGLGVRQPVEIVRDSRDIPHIRAANAHDLFFAQGYAEGSDRLFQMDLVRRYVYGRLAEVLGATALHTDERSRVVDIRGIVAREWNALPPDQQRALEAFSDGVNAAMSTQPKPVEFRLLLYSPDVWKPRDSLAVGFATVLDLTDSWKDVFGRDAKWSAANHALFDTFFPLTDWKYDVPIVGRDAPHAASILGALPATRVTESRPVGSNEWAAGGARTKSGRALLANDPHLALAVPGIWYLIDLQAPGFHVAGGSIAGTPGVILGHNEHIAWGATNGSVSSLSVFHAPPSLPAGNWVNETFHVRFGRDVTERYYRAPLEFGVREPGSGALALVRWDAYSKPGSPVGAFLALDRANSMGAAIAALSKYPGPTQNFVLAGTDGTAAYHLAGAIPNDPAWSRYVHPASDLAREFPAVPFDRLPAVAPSRNAVVFTANNKMYGDGYPYRLSPNFEPPYRAYRVHQLLAARKTYDAAYFAQMQLDTLSPADLEFAHHLLARDARLSRAERDALSHWDGRFTPDSRAATIERSLRKLAATPNFIALLRFERSRGASPQVSSESAGDPALPWRIAGAEPIKHELAALGASFLNGAVLPGNGDNYTIHMQSPGYSQSFRAVWDVGNWDGGGITIPSGESGEPGSRHYSDLSATWIAGRLVPLPFSTRAVEADARERLTLSP
ncbi:MAG: penicillin acylase family protein [Vulcanimicrobiaceae bacterium]